MAERQWAGRRDLRAEIRPHDDREIRCSSTGKISRKPKSQQQMTEVEIAECTVATLTDKRDRTVARIEEIAAERKAVGFAVHADNDKAARKRGSIS
jgi:hypothetical protein